MQVLFLIMIQMLVVHTPFPVKDWTLRRSAPQR